MDETRDHCLELIAPVVAPGEAGEIASGMVGTTTTFSDARRGAYHGSTVAAASLTGLQYAHNAFDIPIENIIHTDCPHYYHYGEEGESEEEFSSRLAANFERLIMEEGPDTVAAFIAEPFLGAGGVIMPPKGYYEKNSTYFAAARHPVYRR